MDLMIGIFRQAVVESACSEKEQNPLAAEDRLNSGTGAAAVQILAGVMKPYSGPLMGALYCLRKVELAVVEIVMASAPIESAPRRDAGTKYLLDSRGSRDEPRSVFILIITSEIVQSLFIMCSLLCLIKSFWFLPQPVGAGTMKNLFKGHLSITTVWRGHDTTQEDLMAALERRGRRPRFDALCT